MKTPIPPFGQKPAFILAGLTDRDAIYLRRLLIEAFQQLAQGARLA